MTRPVIPVILSGGSGTRLWPLSREQRPKQFFPLVTAHSLFQDTLLRTAGLKDRMRAPIVICNEAHRFLVAEQLRAIGFSAEAIVLEPEGRNTAPAVAVAALLGRRASAPGMDPVLLVLPADHVIRAREAFVTAVEAAIEATTDGNLVTFGVVPYRAETGYGYIRRGADQGKWWTVERFVEKPNREKAEHYVASGRYLWNSGMFVFSAEGYLRELGRYQPAIVEACTAAVEEAAVDEDFTRLGEAFLDCPSDSVDYAVMEKTDRAAVVTLQAGWSDVGSWDALHDVLEKDRNGNVKRGDVFVESCSNSYIQSSSRLVAAVGLDGMVVVETPDAVLVMAHDRSQQLKQAVDALKQAERAEVGSSVED